MLWPMMSSVMSLAFMSQLLMAQECNRLSESVLPAPAVLIAREPHDSWRAAFDSDVKVVLPITGFIKTAKGMTAIRPLLFVGTADGTFAIDPDSVCVAWHRPDLEVRDEDHVDEIIGSGLALITQDKTQHMVSMSTGATLWSSSGLSWKKIKAYLPLWRSGVLLVTGTDSADKPLISALEMRRGHTAWTRDLWKNDIEDGQTSAIEAHLHLMPPLYVSDSVVVIWATKDGPIAINPFNGDVHWSVPSLRGRKVPRLGLQPRRAPWIMETGVLYMPYEKRLAALDATTGKVRWDVQLKDPAGRMEIADERLIVQGFAGPKGSIDLRDVATGKSIWGGAITGLKQPSPYVRMGSDEVYLATGTKLVSITLRDGAKHNRGDLDFQASEVPVIARNVGSTACFAAEQNIACIREDGTSAYHLYYPEPDRNMLRGMMRLYSAVSLASAALQTTSIVQAEFTYGSSPQLDAAFDRVIEDYLFEQLIVQVGMSRIAIRLSATNYTRDRAVFLTKRKDTAGENRWTLVEIDIHDGAEVGAKALNGKPRMVLVDPVLGQIIYQQNGRELVALRMAPQR